MTKEKVDTFMLSKIKYFPESSIYMLRERLLEVEDDKSWVLQSVDFKDPGMNLVVSILGGGLGIDRFLIGDTAMGVLKLFTGGFCGILTLIDWFNISRKTKEYNLKKLMAIL